MGFLYSQLFARIPYPKGSYAGKTIIITGSNTGLGKEAARHYIRLGAKRMILAVRNLDKGHAAKDDLQATTKCASSVIEVWQLNMSSYASVQQFAARVNAELDRVDIFNANAGVAKAAFSIVADNEEMITVNVISTLLLTALVIPKLKESAAKYNIQPTLTITSSGAHEFAKFPQKSAPEGEIFNTLNDKTTAEKNWGEQYPVSKMLEIFAVRSIGELSPNSPVTVNCVDPGLCESELSRDHPTIAFWIMKLLLARSTECGSRTLVHGGSQGPESHGKYISDARITQPSKVVVGKGGKELQDRIWGELVKKLEAIKPGVTRNFS